MTGSTVNGARNGSGARSGACTLSLLAAPLNAQVLRALGDGPRRQADLRREAGHPAQTTLRAQLKKLCDASMIEKRRRNRFPGTLEYELSETGGDLLPVIATLERWLSRSPGGPLELGGSAAKAAVTALVEGWSTAILRAIATEPLTLTELDRTIAALNYPSVERRLAAMRLAGLVEAVAGDSRGTPYAVTGWARQAVAPLSVAIRWELRHAPQRTPPLGPVEAQTILLLAAPLLSVAENWSGTCRLALEVPAADDRRLAGVVAEIDGGRVRSCTHRLQADADAWGLGSPRSWLEALTQGDIDAIELGGDGPLARSVLTSLHSALFATGDSVPK